MMKNIRARATRDTQGPSRDMAWGTVEVKSPCRVCTSRVRCCVSACAHLQDHEHNQSVNYAACCYTPARLRV
eukprot:scaffold32261_cov61-Phaeocystis_antarctica.AAC.10